MTVVDASIVVRLLLNRSSDEALRERMARQSALQAPALVDAEVVSTIRSLLTTSKPAIKVSTGRGEQMLDHYATLTILRHPMQPYQRRVLELRPNLTAYDAFYVALAEALTMPLLTDDRKFERAAGHSAVVETWV